MTYEDELIFQLRAAGLPEPEREYKFHPTRKWRFDLAWPYDKLAVEIEGAVWVRGRHTRPSGFIGDCEKYNTATLAGWRVLRVPSDWVTDGKALALIEQALPDRFEGC